MNEELKTALNKVLKLPPEKGFNAYAITYAKAALKNPRTGKEMEGEGLRVQVIYVVNNLQYWRGEEARATKATLLKYTKEE